jgi:hypothetical protein
MAFSLYTIDTICQIIIQIALFKYTGVNVLHSPGDISVDDSNLFPAGNYYRVIFDKSPVFLIVLSIQNIR